MATTTRERTTPDDRRYLERHRDRLSRSTQRAKWVGSTGDRPDRKGQTLATRSHDVIRAWAEERGGVPATATRGPDGRPRTLRIDFEQNGRSDRLEQIDWSDWLGVFDERELVFVYQDQRRDGRQSNFFRLDNPNREEG